MFENEKFDRPDFCDFKTIIEKFLTICLPVTTTPCAKVGNIKTECCGTPIVVPRKHDICCDEMQKNGCCKYTIIQKMKVEIPIDFTADTKVDDLFVDCEFKHDKDHCDKDHCEKDHCDTCQKDIYPKDHCDKKHW